MTGLGPATAPGAARPIRILEGAAASAWVEGRAGATAGEDVSARVREILERVRREGDPALLDYGQQLDGARPASLLVPPERCRAALAALSPRVRAALERAKRNLETFHRAQRRSGKTVEIEPGVRAWREFRPIERVGIYVPGGRAPYPSSVLMTAVPARLAGCGEIVVCSPPGPDGEPAPAVLAAAALAGADEVYAVGGAQAIAALSYGTGSIRPVDKIFGPGSRWVNEAKLQVFGRVAVDLPAGPSEVLVWADSSAPAEWVAAELLAQAEHGPDSLSVGVLDDGEQALRVADRLEARLGGRAGRWTEARREAARATLARSALLVARDGEEAAEWVNGLAAEHVVLMRRDARAKLPSIRHAGSVFLGLHASVAAGDYALGTNHVLPTGRRARGAAGLSLDDFGRWMPVQEIEPEGLARLGPTVVTLAEWEGFDAHAECVRVRLGSRLEVERDAGRAEDDGARAMSAPVPSAPIPSTPFPSATSASAAAAARPGAPAGPGIEGLVRRHLPSLRPYATAFAESRTAGGRVLLDANENSLGTLAPEVDERLHRYPDPASRDLRDALARRLGVPESRLWVGNGSDEALDVLLRTLVEPGETAVVATPSYGMYGIRATTHGALVREVGLDGAFDLDVEATAAAVAETRAKLVLLCSPNNPTGGLLSAERILHLVEITSAAVAVDEAYGEFAPGGSLARLAGGVERLVVLRTLSKAWGLAGARVGALVASPKLIAQAAKVGLPYPLSAPAARAALLALSREDEMHLRRDLLVAERERVRARLEEMGLRVLPSDANFLLFFVGAPGRVRTELARRAGVLVRDRSELPRLEGGLRVTIGTRGENDLFLRTLEAIVAARASAATGVAGTEDAGATVPGGAA